MEAGRGAFERPGSKREGEGERGKGESWGDKGEKIKWVVSLYAISCIRAPFEMFMIVIVHQVFKNLNEAATFSCTVRLLNSSNYYCPSDTLPAQS